MTCIILRSNIIAVAVIQVQNDIPSIITFVQVKFCIPIKSKIPCLNGLYHIGVEIERENHIQTTPINISIS